MTGAQRPIIEDELHGYVDGMLEPGRQAEVERYLYAHPEVFRRFKAYEAQRDDLREAFVGQLGEPLASSLNLATLVEERLTRRRARWPVAASIVLALLVGGAGGWLLGRRPQNDIAALASETAASYAVYVVDEHRPVELWAAQRDDLTRWVSNRLNRLVAPPDLTGAGYQLLGGRLVPTAHGPAAMFMYESRLGGRLMLFVRPMTVVRNTPIEQVDIGDIDGCAWIDRGVGYSVVAAEPYARLLELSGHVRLLMQTSG
jgi:anti-sigma factor RsiW